MTFLSTEPICNTDFVLLGKDIGKGSLHMARKTGQELLFLYRKGNVPKGSF